MNVRFQKTARGEVAILPRAEYELVTKAAEADEDAGTARLVARARGEIASGAPLLPKQVVDRLTHGENPVRVLREWRDVTQLYLSFKTNLSQGYISDVETVVGRERLPRFDSSLTRSRCHSTFLSRRERRRSPKPTPAARRRCVCRPRRRSLPLAPRSRRRSWFYRAAGW